MNDIATKDYRAHKELYKTIGFFVIIICTFLLAFKVAAWFMWAQQCINAAI